MKRRRWPRPKDGRTEPRAGRCARQQLEWFKRQIFGHKSEKRLVAGEDGQMSLGEVFAGLPGHDETPAQDIPAHRRRTPTRKTETGEALPFFDENRVPVEIIELAAPETEGLGADEFELIGHKESYRLAQRPGSYVVLKYRRPVVKVKATEAIHCPPAPERDPRLAGRRELRRRDAGGQVLLSPAL